MIKTRINRILARWLLNRQATVHCQALSSATGDRGSFLTITFDCDNPDDAAAFPEILELLDRYNIRAGFAVCGELVRENPAPYRALADRGHEIINHGYMKHVHLSGSYTISTLYYDRMTPEAITHEIVHNHQVIREILGIDMIGFRAPHFGYVQDGILLRRIFPVLESLGYAYDSSAKAYFYALHRREFSRHAIVEFALSPDPDHVRGVPDSWGYLCHGGSNPLARQSAYLENLIRLLDWSINSRRFCHVNLYMDPSHVVGWSGLEIFLRRVQDSRALIQADTYANLLRRSHRGKTEK